MVKDNTVHVDFAKVVPEGKSEPHITGHAKCLVCNNEWEAVVPAGTDAFECPKCGCVRGYFCNELIMEGADLFVCDCGSDVLALVRKNEEEFLMCLRCGVVHTWA